MPSKKTKDDDTKLFAFLATFLTIVGFIIALAAKKDNKYVMHYAKQSLVIFIAYILSAIVVMIPIVGLIAGPILYVLTAVLWVISWIYALSGEMKQVPIIGEIAKGIKI